MRYLYFWKVWLFGRQGQKTNVILFQNFKNKLIYTVTYWKLKYIWLNNFFSGLTILIKTYKLVIMKQVGLEQSVVDDVG